MNQVVAALVGLGLLAGCVWAAVSEWRRAHGRHDPARLLPRLADLPPWRERGRAWRIAAGTGLVLAYSAASATLSFLLTTSLSDGAHSALPEGWRTWIVVAMLLPVPLALGVDARGYGVHGAGPLGRLLVLAASSVSVFLGVLILTTPDKTGRTILPRRSQLPVTLVLSVVLPIVMVTAVYLEHRSAVRAGRAEQARRNEEARRRRSERRPAEPDD